MPNTSLRQPKNGIKRGGKTAYHGSGRTKTKTFAASNRTEATSADEKWERTRLAHTIDETMGFARFDSGKRREGWLVNIHPTSLPDERNPEGRAAVDCYFIEEGNTTFKASVEYEPYFLVAVKTGYEGVVEEWLKRIGGGGVVKSVKKILKDDLSLPNHLLGLKRTLLELRFLNVADLLTARREIMPVAERNRKGQSAKDAYAESVAIDGKLDLFDDLREDDYQAQGKIADATEFITDIREYDVPYMTRVMIDLDIRVGKWYYIDAKHGEVTVKCNEERLAPADPVVMAFDIETTKLPLKFPDAAIDQIMMISYMIDGNGFLITNREIVSEDIYDFDYTAKAEYPGNFKIFNEPNERAVIERFFNHIKETRPTVIATYNGDFFDWPFVEARSSVNGIDMYQEIGWRKDGEEYQCNYSVHMDCFAWVTRDSYLPQGSRGLKAVTVAKLGYDPDELDPELMTPYARERPQTLAEYSVSDAVATYYLYLKYVHPFIFSLCATLPLGPDHALRKGTGTLCEMLLMVQAYQNGILLPNKHIAPRESFWKGHLINSETYVGGHVESIEAGVFRADIPVNFAMEEGAIDELLRDLDDALKFSITVEEKKSLDDIENYDEIKAKITAQLLALKETPNRTEGPLIYHVDVASMYPNIMTTNRLQPDSMITDADCAACDFNRPEKTCDRRLPWAWRGEYLPAKRDEYNMIRNTLENEKFPGKFPNSPMRPFRDLPLDEQAALTRKRLQDYSKKVYHKIHDSTTMVREAIICQRENPFYVDTVRSFRDRRYDYKGKAKVWKGKKEALKSAGAPTSEVDTANKMIILFDSMQLAHKVILNSFYGYVMRKGSRWYSMEMAGVTCLTGAHIIQMAKELVERLGRPLELDTDGIWCMLPKSFPENFAFKMKNGKKLAISYPCVMLNHLVHAKFTNHQYQTLKDPKSFRYETHSDNSIFFEVDGPYKAMVLPTSKEEDKNLKKRYAVFNDDGSLAELKGFEVKRRGELQLIKIFQQQIFKFFLDGSTLAECYGAVARVADRWLDVLHQKGGDLSDDELLDLICENRMMSKTLQEYGGQKSTSITTAKRLADFLGENMVKDKGLACKFIISANPKGAPVTERAVPVAILSAPEETKRKFLRKWLKGDPPSTDVRDLLDWDYYAERLGSVIQKLITIPAALQKVPNPVPRIPHPEWLRKRIATREDKMQQTKLSFAKLPLNDITNRATPRADDMEDFGSPLFGAKIGTVVHSSEAGSQSKAKMAAKRKSPEPAEIEPPPEELPAVMPSMQDDYVGFIAYQKQKWKRQKEARATRRQLFGDRRGGGNSHIQQSFMRAAHSTFMTTWQLVYLKPEDNNGVVTAHVLIDAKIHSLKIRVPRQIYVNYKRKKLPALQPPKGCVVEKVNHTLPNGRPSALIHRMTMPEESYVGAEQWFCDLRSHPSVEAIYETAVPLYMRALLKLGNVCAIDDTQHAVLGTGLEQGFDLSGLVRPQKGRTYLEDVPLSYIYISHINTPERQIFGIFSTTSDNAHIVILMKQRDAGQDMPNLSKLYAQKLEEHVKEAGEAQFKDFFRYQEKLNFKVTQVTTRRKAHLEVGDVVKKMRKEEPRAQILAIQSLNKESLIRDIPGLGDMPILPLKYDVYDGALPPLGWQSTVARRLVRHYLGLGGELTHLMALARYANVPLCNLERDDPRYLIDINYARRLMTNDVVLWWSAGPRPDHGRNEFDDVTGPLEMIKMPTVNHPGTFNAVCIELEVRNLAINTILTASLINNLEGADANPMSALADISGDVDGIMYSEGAFSNTNILVLREMVKSWWGEACRGSPMADLMVNHLVRWIEDPDSFLYDRALHYYVQLICRKAFQQLMGDFRKVGCQVVFANAGRMILQTGKYDVQNAASYAEYITRSIKSQPLFHFIDLEIKEYWDFLVWYDEYNYGGKGCEEVVGEEGDQALETIMHWQMSTYLPLRLQPTFTKWVAEFVNIMHEVKRPGITASAAAGVGDDGAPRATQLSTRERMKGLEEKRNDAAPGAEDVISGKALERPLKREIAQLIKVQKKEMMHAELEGDYAFPRLPASGFNGKDTRDGVLELVKCLMQVLSLDKNVTSDARLLRRDLLAMFEVREFSKRGNFSNPAGSLRLAGVSCENCAMPRELDFCRDEDLLPDVLPSGARGAQATKTWRCACGWEVSRLELEERLVAEVEKVVVGWATQDARCGKCGAVRVNEFSEHCTCSGAWVDGTDREEVRERVRVYEGVAEYYDLRMLGMVVKEVLEGM